HLGGRSRLLLRRGRAGFQDEESQRHTQQRRHPHHHPPCTGAGGRGRGGPVPPQTCPANGGCQGRFFWFSAALAGRNRFHRTGCCTATARHRSRTPSQGTLSPGVLP